MDCKIGEDKRIAFVGSYLLKAFRLKPDIWSRLLATQEYKDMLIEFLDEQNTEKCFFSLSSQGILDLTFRQPNGKFSYFVRKILPSKITSENIRTAVLYGNDSSHALSVLSILADHVILPIFNNSENFTAWPNNIEQYVEMEFHELQNSVTTYKGRTIRSAAILPMPNCIENANSLAPDNQSPECSALGSEMNVFLGHLMIKWSSIVSDVTRNEACEMIISKNENSQPSTLVDYWKSRLHSLENIADQFRETKTKKLAHVLQKIGSPCFESFGSIFHQVMSSLAAARDVTLYLLPLENALDKFSGVDFEQTSGLIKFTLETVCLVCLNSKYYRVNEYISVMFQLLNNMIITLASKSVDPESIFKVEIDEALFKIRKVKKMLINYRKICLEILESFEEYKTNRKTKPQQWILHHQLIFSRFERYLSRLQEIEEILENGFDILKLEKLEVGGLQGRKIAIEVTKILEKFRAVYLEWGNIEFDPLSLNIACTKFEAEKNKYRDKIDTLRQEIEFQLQKATEECCEPGRAITFLQLAGSMLGGSVKNEFTFKVADMLSFELDSVIKDFNHITEQFSLKGFPAIPKDESYPDVSGTLIWLHKLRNPLQELYEKFIVSDFKVGVNITDRLATILERFKHFELDVIQNWCKEASATIAVGLDKPLLLKTLNSVCVNFHPMLLAVFKDLRYLTVMHYDIPVEILAFSNEIDNIWVIKAKLQRICNWYNYILNSCDPSETELIKPEIKNIEISLEPAFDAVNWQNYSFGFIAQIFEDIQMLYDRLCKAQANINRIKSKIDSFGNCPLYKRKKGNSTCLLNFDERHVILERMNVACCEINELIEETKKINLQLLLNLPASLNEQEIPLELLLDSQSLHFRPYLEYYYRVITNCILQAIRRNFYYIESEMENRSGTNAPVFEVKMELQETQVVYSPNLEVESQTGFLEMFAVIFSDILGIASKILEVTQPQQIELTELITKKYLQIIRENQGITKLRNAILEKVEAVIVDIQIHAEMLRDYEFLWLSSPKTYLHEFKTYGRSLTEGKREMLGSMEFNISDVSSFLDMYKMQMDKFDKLSENVKKWDTYNDFSTWLRLDKKAFKIDVLNRISKWSSMFKQDLIYTVLNALQALEDFILKTTNILKNEIHNEDFEGLLEIMSTLKSIDERKFTYDNMFEPLDEFVDLLKQYGYEFPDRVHQQFKKLPEAWIKVQQFAATVKQAIVPIKSYQVDMIERRINLFENRVEVYRNKFSNLSLFRAHCKNVYEQCDESNRQLNLLEKHQETLKQSAELFGIRPPESSKIFRIRKELRMMKKLWDFVLSITTVIDSWKKTLWSKIDIDFLDQECKRYGRELRTLDMNVRVLDPYRFAESILTNLMTSLKAVVELQNPAIRERHWLELMKTSKLKFFMGPTTTLENLLDLNLHKHVEVVKNVVDQSVKEMAIEKVLKNLQSTWRIMEFEHDIHERTKLKILRVCQEMLDTLEDHQVQLQNLLSSKYVACFLRDVTDWQIILSNVGQIVSDWLEVQKKWCYLESIFIESEDIKKQLPEDFNRFAAIDRQFQHLLTTIVPDKNVIKLTNRKGLQDKLEFLNYQLSLCEKTLNNYLNTKRLAYPRFYFVSSADLLDILANANKPERVVLHFPKLFDSLANLSIELDTKTAKCMISKEHNEIVPFLNGCDCSGKIEVWLNRVNYNMRITLRELFRKAIASYEEKPRHVWVFEWQAQPALCATQICWNSETVSAFNKLSLGYEYALKDFQKKQIIELNSLITLLLQDLTPGDRQKVMTICTIDVHSRDVVAKLISQQVESALAFQWQSQLRHRWDSNLNNCFANICDAQFKYDYEYLGNSSRLVITPLTDRCYITLTQALHLVLGGAPAGPAGTGKTETTKDLGRALGVMVYVFNCSDQMDYKSCGNIHQGLAQTGAWGCFDEFNRISVEVLSVVAVQVKSIQDGIRAGKEMFNFMGDLISLVPSVGLFVTMNPGYAGRTELPENLKALYRPCAMVTPDFALICEIMLVAEGFQEAKVLSRKFITLYTLCRELLSKQDHYDWGLRAIKSVLVVAGALRRDDLQRPEDQVLMRALRDFNIPKVTTDDLQVFMGLIGDLFPALQVPRKRNKEFEEVIIKSAIELRLQADEGFVSKVVQLDELFAVRHSVFIIGNAGTGKTEIWRTLYKTHQKQMRKPVFSDLNPKTITSDELFGAINPSTREWKDGLFSLIMRQQSNMRNDGPRWIVLDGDIDPLWIESLNTVMDDNKILTLANNERIALTKEMRLLFEISNLRTATPATVSRAGILYINPQDLGWNPYVQSWLNTRPNETEKTTLNVLFEKYIPALLGIFKRKMKTIISISTIAMLQMTTYLLEILLTSQNLPPECPKDWYEIYFVFAVVWGFGSTLCHDQIIDWQNEFHKWWLSEFKTIKLPSGGNIFSFYVDNDTKKFLPWSTIVPTFELNAKIPLQSTLVHTTNTIRLKYFIDALIEAGHPVMIVGPTGAGKSLIVNECLQNLPKKYTTSNVPLNFCTNSETLQRSLEFSLEKKVGRNYAPIGNKNLIYFVDDMNMPAVDAYGTVPAHALIRQFMDYRHWYDRVKLTLKDIYQCQFITCMNPSAGSFTINPRLQRHFSTFAANTPSVDDLNHILKSILSQHLQISENKFSINTQHICESLVKAAVCLHVKVGQMFMPTAAKFHYNFNLRDLANIFSGLLYADATTCPNPDFLIRLWYHEALRVYADKLVDENDVSSVKKLISSVMKKELEIVNETLVLAEPIIYCHFTNGLADSKYMPASNWESLYPVFNEAMQNYNEYVGSMNLVLFEAAIAHICRISRILESSVGNALLIGVGGSGKQSLTRLAAFISSLNVFQSQLTKAYAVANLKADIAALYIKAGLKSNSCCFLMTDAQIAQEDFLVIINDMLASREIQQLFTDEETSQIIESIRNEVKHSGITDSRENCWKFFIAKVRRNLKVVLCFSPIGSTLRSRARKFPAIVNCSSIDWFHDWPYEALQSVSREFLSDISELPVQLNGTVSEFMAFAHHSVRDISENFKIYEKRFNYTTPKSFLELIHLYSKLLKTKVKENIDRTMRIENGLIKLAACEVQVDGLQQTLLGQEEVLKEKAFSADKLITLVAAENQNIQKERNLATEEEQIVRSIEEKVSGQAKICEEDLRRAEPALIAAEQALDTLNKSNLTELKSFDSPPEAVINVCAAVLVLFSQKSKVPKDRSWKNCKMLMSKVDKFLNDLKQYDKKHIHPNVIAAIQPYLTNPDFNPAKIKAKSSAAAGLCEWVININKFYSIFLIVEPKQRALKNAQAQLTAARDKLQYLRQQLTNLEEKLSLVQKEYDSALSEKASCQNAADQTTFKIDLANRLVNGLTSEKNRWKQLVESLKFQQATLPGDVLLISCFIGYVGGFSQAYRGELLERTWIPHLKNLKPEISCSERTQMFEMIFDDAQIAEWNNQGLPYDQTSVENAAIFTHCERYPIMIDPQLQGLKWVKKRYGRDLVTIRLSEAHYIETIKTAVTEGSVLLIENIGESIDTLLEPLLSRALKKQGTCLQFADQEINFNPKFRLILQTKLSNPHYQPEIQAQTTIINFTITKQGLEEQLLTEVIKAERPDLEQMRTKLITQQNNFKIMIKSLEEDLLQRLSSAGENVLEDTNLILNLEKIKKTADEVEIKVKEAKATSIQIDKTRELYRRAASRASILYFVQSDLCKMNPVYVFSLKAFRIVFKESIKKSISADNVEERVNNLEDSITYSVYMYTSRGLFEKDKLTFLFHMALQLLLAVKEIDPKELDFLLRYPYVLNLISPVPFLNSVSWGGIKALTKLPAFKGLDEDIEGSYKRWQKFLNEECPEKSAFPGEWKTKSAFQRLCMMRALRPDRMVYAIECFIKEKLASKYLDNRSLNLSEIFKESSASTHIFFILSPGFDPLTDVENLGRTLGFSFKNENLYNISMGQGQELRAENIIDLASENGFWLILENIHLVAKWLPSLERKIEATLRSAHKDYRLFLTAEPASSADLHILPPAILQSAIKITNEPPSGMKANLHIALDNFSQETLEMCSKETEFKTIFFSLCYFHAAVTQRQKFGPHGWNRSYPFKISDLKISVNVLHNYLESNNQIPWEDLRYLVGEIMYGGHITDQWDRRLCQTYLDELLRSELIDGEFNLCPGFLAPPTLDYEGYHKYIANMLPAEHPLLYGLHANAEIGFSISLSENLFQTVFELQPRTSDRTDSLSHEEIVQNILEDLCDKMPKTSALSDLISNVEEMTPFATVALQEHGRMNILMQEISRSLKALELSLKGELTFTLNMENLMESLFMDKVPESWTKYAYPSLLGLQSWFSDFLLRQTELELWCTDFRVPSSVWLGGLFNPESFLTAIMQQTARKYGWPLDKMYLNLDVTKKKRNDISLAPKEGVYVHSLFMDGASWDSKLGTIADAHLREFRHQMPVVFIKAVTQDKQDSKNSYECPLYKTRLRGPTYVWTFNLKTKEKAAKWTLAGVCLLLQS